ncbi:MAG: Gfo/Idh/MocA family oxidoreductase [Phycisphaeraceae bacterium]
MHTHPTIRWGILGCGNVCEVKSGPAFQLAEGSVLTKVMRRTPLMAEDFATRHGVPNWTGDVDDLIDDPDVDAVYIATPPGSHCEYALRVCAAGKPCYVEKPMARNAEECQRMVEAFADADLPLYVAYYRRALPRFLKAKELLDSGTIGRITHVSYRYERPADPGRPPGWRVEAEQSGGGLLLDLGSHTLDILDYLLGPLQHVEGWAENLARLYPVEDHVEMNFTVGGSATGQAVWNFAADRRHDLIEIQGTQGSIKLSTFGNEPLHLATPDGVESFDLPNPTHIQQPLIQTIVNELRGLGTCPSTGTTAARTSAVIDRVLTGYYGRRDDDFWNRPDSWPARR